MEWKKIPAAFFKAAQMPEEHSAIPTIVHPTGLVARKDVHRVLKIVN